MAKNALLRKNLFFAPLLQNISIAFLLLVVFASGCKKVDELPGLTGICPEVVSTNPANADTGVSIATKVTASFNEVMDPGSLATSFTLKQGTTLIAGEVSYTGVTATFIPANTLANNTTYTATITTGAKDPAGNALVKDYVWTFKTGSSTDLTSPIVISTDPANNATGVVLNKKISAIFNEPMNPLSITTGSFLLKAGTTAITGVVSYSGTTAVFSPSANLTANTLYTATITTGAKDVGGNTMESNYVWSFTTGATTDIIFPTVTSTDPIPAAIGVDLNKIIAAVFSEAMNSLTINNSTFTLKQGLIPLTGLVSYSGTTAYFNPSIDLLPNTIYTATITTGAQDLAGNALQANYTWSFTTGLTLSTPILGSASVFGAFGGNAGITNQGINTRINNGSIGTTAASSLITGFTDGTTGDVYTITGSNNGLVSGRIYTAPPAPGNATSFAIATQGLLDATAAFNATSPASMPGGTDPGAGELGGLTLPPGVYKSASGTFKISNGNLTLDAMGNPNATWTFQTGTSLTVGIAGPTGARSIILANGATAKNVYWHVGTAATINGAGGGVMVGTIISMSGVTFSTAGNATQTVLNGRAISLIASVTMVNTTINVPN